MDDQERRLSLLESPLYPNIKNSKKLSSPNANRKRHSLNRQSNSFEPYNNFSGSQRVINNTTIPQKFSTPEQVQKKSLFSSKQSRDEDKVA